MDKNNSDIKLNETIKRTLRSYEVSYNAADWAQMESMLDVAPKQNPLGRSYSPIILYSLIILGAAFLLYNVFKSSDAPEKINTTYTSPIVKKKSIEKAPAPIPVETHSVIAVPAEKVVVKEEIKPAVKPVATHSNTTAPAITSVKKEVKITEKKVVEKKIVEKKTPEKKAVEKKTDEKKTVEKKVVDKKTIENKNSKPTTLSSQESKAKLFQKTLEKNKKTTVKEVKQESSDTVHIDDENDSNRRTLKTTNPPTTGVIDTVKSTSEKKKSTRKSRRERKTTTVNDTLSKNPPSN